jgi:tagaturonate reductase
MYNNVVKKELKPLALPLLNRNVHAPAYRYPVKALQIGEGNFIRAFVDWMIHRTNEQGLFKGSIVATQPRPQGAPKLQKLKEQDGLFTLVIRGMDNGFPVDEAEVVGSISAALDPYEQWAHFLKLAEETDLEIIFSNTTEAGITYVQEEKDFSKPIHSFPGRLAALMYRRFEAFGGEKGLIIVPCELLERAGDELKKIVLQHADDWQLGAAFKQWVNEKNVFLNSLVDRIVTGYPQTEADALCNMFGYEDRLLTVCEPYYQWVIEGDRSLAAKLPFQEAGLNVEWVDDLEPYIKRKVRILNGSHTFMVPMAYLHGYDIVRDAVEDATIRDRVHRFLEQVVVPVLPFDRGELHDFIRQTLERFRNPYIDHRLLDIALNGSTKFSTRILPTLCEYIRQEQTVPEVVAQSLAYFIRFYRLQQTDEGWQGWRMKDGLKEEYVVRDDEQALRSFAACWNMYEGDRDEGQLVRRILSSSQIWETPVSSQDLGTHYEQLVQQTAHHVKQVLHSSVYSKGS